MFGDTIEPNVIDWFGESFIIEHDIKNVRYQSDLYEAFYLAFYLTGNHYEKLTEVIAGNSKGLLFASLSGSFPLVIDISKPQAKVTLSKMYDFACEVSQIDDPWDRLEDAMFEAMRASRYLKKDRSMSISLARKDVNAAVVNFFERSRKLIESNLRRFIV